MLTANNAVPCQNKQYYVTENKPVVCPPPDERIWDAHPRVYLNLDESGHVNCPYCGTAFILKK